MKKDYYLILHVRPEASAEEVRSAYRQRAREVHPDASGSGSEPFLDVQEAYSVLSDPSRRAAYDNQSGDIPVRHSAGWRTRVAEPLRAFEPASGPDDVSLLESFDRFGPSFDELFNRLWSNFEGVSRPKAERLESLTVDVPLSPAQALKGGTVRLLVPSRAICPKCQGRGAVGRYLCWECEGHGSLTAEYPVVLSHPAGMRQDRVVQVPLRHLGIDNFYLTVRFRITGDS